MNFIQRFISWCTQHFYAAKVPDKHVIEEVQLSVALEESTDCMLNDIDDPNGKNTALHLAVSAGDFDLVKELVEKGADLAMMNDDYFSPLMLAVKQDQTIIASYLIENGAEINPLGDGWDTADWNDNSPLCLAVINGNLELVKKMISCGVCLYKKHSTYSPVNLAVAHNRFDILCCFVENHISLDFEIDYSEVTPLCTAIEHQNFDLVKYLVECGTDINDYAAWSSPTALHVAAEIGNYSIVEYLIECGADLSIKTPGEKDSFDVYTKKNGLGMTPFEIAEKKGHTRICTLLSKAMANKTNSK